MRLSDIGGAVPTFRLVRSEGRRAIAEVDHRSVGRARAAWNGAAPTGPALETRRTWGTLVGAKNWLRRGPDRPRSTEA